MSFVRKVLKKVTAVLPGKKSTANHDELAVTHASEPPLPSNPLLHSDSPQTPQLAKRMSTPAESHLEAQRLEAIKEREKEEKKRAAKEEAKRLEAMEEKQKEERKRTEKEEMNRFKKENRKKRIRGEVIFDTGEGVRAPLPVLAPKPLPAAFAINPQVRARYEQLSVMVVDTAKEFSNLSNFQAEFEKLSKPDDIFNIEQERQVNAQMESLEKQLEESLRFARVQQQSDALKSQTAFILPKEGNKAAEEEFANSVAAALRATNENQNQESTLEFEEVTPAKKSKFSWNLFSCCTGNKKVQESTASLLDSNDAPPSSPSLFS